MAQGPDGKTIIIVKKVSGHGGHHGGAWKVAYADFVTAMMALFLVLWLVNSASVPTKQAIASYFKRPGVFELGSGTPLEIGGAGVLPDAFAPPAEKDTQMIPNKRIYDEQDGVEKPAVGSEKQKQEFENIASELSGATAEQKKAMQAVLGNVDIKVDQKGLHIEIMDTPTASMFERGQAGILPEAKSSLFKIATILSTLPNPIDIEGHTDAKPFRSKDGNYDNWDLSTDRANAARRVFLEAGITDKQIARVVGYSSQRLKVEDDPEAAPNRRITVSMRFTEQAKSALQGTQTFETKSTPLGKKADGSPANAPKADAQLPVVAPPPANAPATSSAAPATAADVSALLNQAVKDSQQSGPRVELSTPPAEPEVETREPEAEQNRPWRAKDKIFDDNNPFFN